MLHGVAKNSLRNQTAHGSAHRWLILILCRAQQLNKKFIPGYPYFVVVNSKYAMPAAYRHLKPQVNPLV